MAKSTTDPVYFAGAPLDAPELSKRISIPRTTTFRLLQMLEALRFLEHVQDEKSFRLGVGLLRLASSISARWS